MYWYCERPVRPPTRRSWAAWRNRLMPGTLASLGRSRLMTASALILRSA